MGVSESLHAWSRARTGLSIAEIGLLGTLSRAAGSFVAGPITVAVRPPRHR
jgi:hypothetical protein